MLCIESLEKDPHFLHRLNVTFGFGDRDPLFEGVARVVDATAGQQRLTKNFPSRRILRIECERAP